MPNKNENGARKPLGSVENWAGRLEEELTKLYGTTVSQDPNNFRKAELDEIKLTAPKDLGTAGEAFVTLLSIGATLKPEYLKDAKSSSTTGGANQLKFNMDNMISHVPKGDTRFLTKDCADAMLKGRIDAANALAQYNQGNFDAVKAELARVLEEVGDLAQELVLNDSTRNINHAFGAIAMVDRLRSANLPFDLKTLVSETKWAKIEASINLCKVHTDVMNRLESFQTAPGAAGSPERDQMLSQLALGMNMLEFYHERSTADSRTAEKWLGDTLRNNGIAVPETIRLNERTDFNALRTGKYKLITLVEDHRVNVRNNSLTGLEYAYSRPDAPQWFEQKYMEAIKQTPAYKALLNEQDPLKLKAGIAALREEISKNGGMKAFVKDGDFAEFEDARKNMDAAREQDRRRGQEALEVRAANAVADLNKGKRLREILARSVSGLGDSAETAALRDAVAQFTTRLNRANPPELDNEAVQQGLRDVVRLAAEHTRSVRERAGGQRDENWEPRAGREAYRAARDLETNLAEFAVYLPVQQAPQNEQQPFRARPGHPQEILREIREGIARYGIRRGVSVTLDEKREIDRTVQLFAAIPATNTDKAIDALLAREEQYRAEHMLDQSESMASAVRTVMLLSVKKRFAPKAGELPAETVRRHQAMKEALNERRVVNNLADLYLSNVNGAYSPIEGVVLRDAGQVIIAAMQQANEIDGGATTQDILDKMNEHLAQLTPYVDAGEEKVAFYEGSGEFEQRFLGGGTATAPENAEAYQKVSDAIKGLNNTLEPFYERNNQGELPVLTEEDFAKIREGYRNVLDELYAFSQQASQSGRPLDMERRQMMDKFREKLGRDVIALEAGRQMGLSNLPNILLGGNLPAAEIDGSPEAVGDKASTRLRVNLPGPGGATVKGFFTPASFVSTSDEKALRELIDREAAGHPEWKSVMEKFFKADDPLQGGRGYLSYLGPNGDLARKMRSKVDQSALFDELYPDKIPREEFNAVRGHEFSLALYRVAQGYTNHKGMMNAYREQGLLSGNLDKRNSAMTTMADFLNVPKLVAPAKSVTVKIDGKEIVGTFMAFAEGEDLIQVAPDSSLARVKPEDMFTPQSVSAIADLQVLDYICGNVDRHSRNLFYKMDNSDPQRPKCVGVQGIDNDFSFCANANGKSLADVMNMKIIREDMAKALFTMNPGMLRTVLGGYDLSGEEIDAALKRVGELKQAVDNGDLKVVTDEQIKTMNYAKELMGGNNYFDRMLTVPRQAKKFALNRNSAEMDRAYGTLRDNTSALGGCYTGLVDANRGWFVGSSEFRAVKADMEDLMAARNELLDGRDPERLAQYLQKLEKLRADMEKYLQKKEKEARKSKPSKLAEKRTAAVRALSEKIALEHQGLSQYLAAQQLQEATLQSTEAQARRSQIEQAALTEESVYLARGAAKDLFPKLESRENPLLKQNGAILRAEADAVFASALEPETPELREQRERLYAGLIADRILQKRLEKNSQSVLSAWEKDPQLFEKTRNAVMQTPGFRDLGTTVIHTSLHSSLGKPKTLDRITDQLEQKMAQQAAALKKPEPAKDQNVQQAGQKTPEIKHAKKTI